MTDEQKVKQEAARWFATLRSGERNSVLEDEFLSWQRADPRHARMMEEFHRKMSAFGDPAVTQSRAEAVAAALAVPSRRRFLRGAFTLAIAGTGAWLATRVGSTGFVNIGDLYTSIAERRTFTLEDGSMLTLNAASRVTPGPRSLRLRQGEALIDVAASSSMTFEVQTDLLQISASSAGRVQVRQTADSCYVLALDCSIDVHNAQGFRQTLAPKNWLQLSTQGSSRQGRAKGGEIAWLQGLLVVENLSLQEVVERLRPYHLGVLRLQPTLANLRISGAFPLDNTGKALQMLVAALPIRLVTYTSFWEEIVPA